MPPLQSPVGPLTRVSRCPLSQNNNSNNATPAESCVPIYPPAMVHQQLLQDTKSRINACPDTGLDTNLYR